MCRTADFSLFLPEWAFDSPPLQAYDRPVRSHDAVVVSWIRGRPSGTGRSADGDGERPGAGPAEEGRAEAGSGGCGAATAAEPGSGDGLSRRRRGDVGRAGCPERHPDYRQLRLPEGP